MEKFHRAFGVYGILGDKDYLTVIKKNGGPYTNRFDLPGGSLEDGEELSKAINREFHEETGLNIIKSKQVGITSFRYPWKYLNWNYNQHICVFYHINSVSGNLLNRVKQFDGQDSLGALQMPLKELDITNCSPLVLKAKDFLLNDHTFKSEDTTFKEWKVLAKSVF